MEGAVDGGALKAQLACLQDQARQLSSLVGDDPQSPLLPLQVRFVFAYSGVSIAAVAAVWRDWIYYMVLHGRAFEPLTPVGNQRA